MLARTWLLALALVACDAPSPAGPSLDPEADRAAHAADIEAARLLGTDARLVFRRTATTPRAIYGTGSGTERASDELGLFAVYASPGSGLFAEVFVRYDGTRVAFATITRDPIRR